MPETPDLAAMFLNYVRGRPVPPSDVAGLNRVLAQALESARARWPVVKLAPELFMKHLAERLPGTKPERPIEEILGPLCLEELYLACACLHQIPLAAETFEQHYLRKLPGKLRHRERSAAAIDEICQLASVKILVATDEGPPKIAEYNGTGDLQNWVGVIASRIAARQTASQKPPVLALDEEIMEKVSKGDPADRFIKTHHQQHLRHAFHEAFSSLTDKDRYLLRLYYVDGLSMYEMADLLRLSQPTVSRRLGEIRTKISTEIRRHLQVHLGLSQQDFESFINIVDSQFDLRLSRLLGEAVAPERPLPPR